jgi:hypothetical protein
MASPALAPTGQTGPRTAEGKAASSQNSTTHGLSSARVVLPHEDQAAFLQLSASLHADLAAKGAHEAFLAQQMAESQWRLNRIRRIETALMNQILLGADEGPDPEDHMARAMIERGGDPLGKIERYAAAAERSYYRARREIAAYRKAQNEFAIQRRLIDDREEALRRRAENEADLAARRPKFSPQPTSEPCERPTPHNLTSERQRTSKIEVALPPEV